MTGALAEEIRRGVPEMTLSNAVYGHGAALRAWSGFTGPIPAGIQHGAVWDAQELHPADTQSPFGAYMPWSPTMHARWEAESDKAVIAGCAPWLYVLDMTEQPQRHGTLFMPCHSTELQPMDADWYLMARSLEELPQPVTVCMYYLDIEMKRDRDFRKRGYEVVTAGGIMDRAFLPRLAGYIRGSELVASNGVGTHAFYSIAADTPFFLHGPAPVTNFYGGFEPQGGKDEEAYVDSLFRDPGPITDAQRAVASHYLGSERKRTPEQLAADLTEAKLLTARNLARATARQQSVTRQTA